MQSSKSRAIGPYTRNGGDLLVFCQPLPDGLGFLFASSKGTCSVNKANVLFIR